MLLKSSHDIIPSAPFDLDCMLAGQLSASSIRMYTRDVRAYEDFCHDTGRDPLNPQSLATWRDALVAGRAMSPNTINRMLSAVKRVVKEAATREMIEPYVSAAFHEIPGVQTKAMKDRLKQH